MLISKAPSYHLSQWLSTPLPRSTTYRGWSSLCDPVKEITPQVIIDVDSAMMKIRELTDMEASEDGRQRV